MRYLTVMIALILFCGCTAKHTDITERFNLPKELQDYRVVVLFSDAGNHLYVLVKKNEDRNIIGTTSPQGIIQMHTIVVDGETYVKKDVQIKD